MLAFGHVALSCCQLLAHQKQVDSIVHEPGVKCNTWRAPELPAGLCQATPATLLNAWRSKRVSLLSALSLHAHKSSGQ